MKQFFSLISSLLLTTVLLTPARAQNVGIGTSTPAASAALDVTAPANDKGFLPPRLSEAQRNAIASPAPGLTIFNTDSKHLNVWDGSSWTAPVSNDEAPYVPGTQTFYFTGGPQTYTVPRDVTSVVIDAHGASGMEATQSPFGPGGNGARVQATLAVTPGQVLTVMVGSSASRNPFRRNTSSTLPPPPGNGGGGYNGGGDGGLTVVSSSMILPGVVEFLYEYRGGGGGASDVRVGGTALTDRVVVAAGGGGTRSNATGGNGGLNGAAGSSSGGQGGTQTAGGAGAAQGVAGTLGQGGRGYDGSSSAGGGGGYYGGGGSGGGGGGGGSSYTAPTGITDVTVTAGARVGNGMLTISPTPAMQYQAPAISGANVVLPAASADGAVVFTGTPGLTTKGSQFFWDNANNRLGIGTATPAQALHLADRLQVDGGVIQRGGAAITGTSDLGLYSRVSGNFMRFVTNAAPINFYSDDNTGSTVNMTIAANGNVGIGTSGPANRLQVVGGGGTSIDLTVNGRMRTGDGGNAGGVYLNGASTQFVGQFSATHLGFYNNNAWRVVISDLGRVGIGTTNPLVPLDVQGTGSIGNYYFSYYALDDDGSASENPGNVSIRANGRVVGAEFNATSDRRLKSIIGLSNSATDLSLLTKVRITDYTMRDRALYGGQQFKKVIAQEVEEIFPQAVHQQTGFLPDVYAVATAVRREGDSLLVISLPAGLSISAHAGQRLKLATPTGEVIGTVARPAAAGTRQLLVRGAASLAGSAQVFVFGLEHADVRTVDYEALAMLNVSATQELARQLAAAQAQLRQQATRADQAEATLGSFEQRLRCLETTGSEQARR